MEAFDTFDFHCVRTREPARPTENANALALEDLGVVVAHPVLDAFDAGGQALDVDFGIVVLQPHAFETIREADRTAGGNHRLRRNAVPQVGRSTDDVALDHGDLSPHPRRMRRRIVTGWAAAEDDKSCAHTVRLRE